MHSVSGCAMGRHNKDCLRGWRKRRKAKKKQHKASGLLKWNKICNVYRLTSVDSEYSEVGDVSSEGSPEHCWCSAASPDNTDLDDAPFSGTQTAKEQEDTTPMGLGISDEHDTNSVFSERDTESSVAEMFAIDTPSPRNQTKKEKRTYHRCVQKMQHYSNDPLYAKMLEYNSHKLRLHRLQAKALENLEKPFH